MIRVLSECDPNYDKPDSSFLNAVTTSVLNSQKVKKAKITFIFASDELLAELKSEYFKRNRNIMLASIGVGLLYRTYLYFASENLYSKYGATVDDGDSRHKKIEDYDRLKPATDIVTGFMVFPIIYYHSKHMQMERWLYE